MVSASAWPPAGRLLSWLVTALVIGWLVVYNVQRLAGGSPSEVAQSSLILGAAVGVAGFGLAIVLYRALARAGRLPRRGPAVVPEPSQLTSPQRTALRLAGPFVALLAAAGVGLGVYLGVTWLQEPADERPVTMAILAGWNLLIGFWLSDEYVHVRRLDGQGLDAVGLGAVITAVLASVGLARDMAAAGQVAMIVIAGVTAVCVYYASWRLTRRGRAPIAAVLAAAVATLALVVPLVA